MNRSTRSIVATAAALSRTADLMGEASGAVGGSSPASSRFCGARCVGLLSRCNFRTYRSTSRGRAGDEHRGEDESRTGTRTCQYNYNSLTLLCSSYLWCCGAVRGVRQRHADAVGARAVVAWVRWTAHNEQANERDPAVLPGPWPERARERESAEWAVAEGRQCQELEDAG